MLVLTLKLQPICLHIYILCVYFKKFEIYSPDDIYILYIFYIGSQV